MTKDRIFYWPWSKPVLPPTHLEVAALELEQARLDLLAKEKELESAECSVAFLKKRVTRLENYS